MTDTKNEKKPEVIEVRPDSGAKKFFFEFINQKLDDLNNRVVGNDFRRRHVHQWADINMLLNLGLGREELAKTGLNELKDGPDKDKEGNILGAKEAVNMLISDSKRRIRSIIMDRLEEMKRNRETRSVDRKIKRLDRQEAREVSRRCRKIKRSGFSSKYIKNEEYEIGCEVALKNEKKRDSLLARKAELDKAGKASGATFGSVFKEVKLISKARAEIIRAENRKKSADMKHQFKDIQLKQDRVLLTALGVVTSPAKLAVDGVNRIRESEGYKKAKRDVRAARVVSARKALHFKHSCKKLWVGGKKMLSNVGEWIKNSPEKAKGLAISLADSAKSGLKAMKQRAVARREGRKAVRDMKNQVYQNAYNAAMLRQQGQGM